ncbi:glutamate carboxypeptidase [Trichophyton violaceum]|uniref:Glutamate carboxypeptidase n=1 Tax=Trichophyton violaceum TaxID=34388 RepID=A0A178FS47_TRIVO|nr:glutamate carboxypeptidase [Trichophyton violaceum]
MNVKSLSLLTLAAATVEGCVRERDVGSVDILSVLSKRGPGHPNLPHLSKYESMLINSFDNTTVDSWAYYYTHGIHIAGTNQSMAQWTADKWTEFGIPSSLVSYDVYLNYPVSHSLSLTHADGTTWEASLVEDVLKEDETSSYPDRIPTFHGYSASGEATAEYVYVGRGQKVDFERLIQLGVDLKGKIAIARYGGPFRGLKVKNAQDQGMIGCIIFTDPADDGNVTVANGLKAYPNGPARNPSAVQRGSVQFLSMFPGDPTTPGYPSRPDSPRKDKSPVVPKIPSIPISQLDAEPILAALDGHGTPGKEVNRTRWVGALNATYATGPAPGAKLSMSNVMRDTYTPIWNSIGIINGTEQDEVIIIGNHRDAWIIGGAGDPNSGSSIMVELAKAFGKLQKAGWKPKRTIVMCSWDAEEYGLVGSTEWVEEYLPWLKASTVAYLNIDVAVSGPVPDLSATPELHKLALESMKKVIWPYKGRKDTTMYDVWNTANGGEVGVLGSGSDYTAFVHNGIASLDTGAGGDGNTDPVYHYHSNYDSYHWMATYGDPGFHTHVAMGQFLGLLGYHLATDDIIPFDVTNYGVQMTKYLDVLKKYIAASKFPDLDVSKIESAICSFNVSANAVAKLQKKAEHSVHDMKLKKHLNTIYRDFGRGFVSQGGLPDREFYRHMLYAPGLDTGYAPTTFPGVTESLDAGNRTRAVEFVERASNAIYVAAGILSSCYDCNQFAAQEQ